MNPYHGADGRFTTEGGAVTFSTHGKSGGMGATEGPQTAPKSVAHRTAEVRRKDVAKLARKKLPELRKMQTTIALQKQSAYQQWQQATDPGIRQRLAKATEQLDAMDEDVTAAIDRVAFPEPKRKAKK